MSLLPPLTGSHKPRFHDVAKLCRRALVAQQLDGVVPAHTAQRAAAADQYDFGLVLVRSGRHGLEIWFLGKLLEVL